MLKSAKSNRRGFDLKREPRMAPFSSELKINDSPQSTLISNTGTAALINFPAQGLAFNQRVADRLRIAHLELNFQINLVGAVNDFCRVLIVQERGLTAAAPTAAGLLQAVTTYAPYLYNMQSLYHVLFDGLYSMPAQGDTAVHQVRTTVVPVIREIQFTPATTTAYSGQIYVFLLDGTLNNVNYNAQHRLYFEDTN